LNFSDMRDEQPKGEHLSFGPRPINQSNAVLVRVKTRAHLASFVVRRGCWQMGEEPSSLNILKPLQQIYLCLKGGWDHAGISFSRCGKYEVLPRQTEQRGVVFNAYRSSP
jgi:hypothetical protein